jgi:formylglycine-generating enzyme required for sulfatase activity
MTQAQWTRIAGDNPSAQLAGGRSFDGVRITGLHPVEHLSWLDCDEILPRLGLRMPTEVQWEHAARAGTETPWWTGQTRDTLTGAANIADAAASRLGVAWQTIDDWPGFDDGFGVQAPVNALRPNPFGLHHVHGNVSEWCLDKRGKSEKRSRPGDGSRKTPLPRRVAKGGDFGNTASAARIAASGSWMPDTRVNRAGVRPARVLDPAK